VTDNLTFLKDNSFIWTSEKDGFNHIYHYDKTGKLINQVTKGNWEVTNYYGYHEKKNIIFYQSVENGSINRDVYAVKLNGRHKERLTKTDGTNSASFSADFSLFINTHSSATMPPEYTLNSSETGDVIKRIKDNKKLLQSLSNYKLSKKAFSTIQINGNDLNMWIIKPADFDASKTYPLLMYQYSGPGSQQVANTWNSANDYWYQHLAQQGYVIACVDGRGTGFKGAAFKKVTQNELGKYEVEDQIAAAKQLGELPYIDANRIGIWGWSYGGFMSSNCLFKGHEVFNMAIAVAPVSSWRFYDTIYTERYMTTPQENESGYDENSPINHVDKLKGDFLLVHGSGDDNVHLQNTMRLAEALIQADKQFDWAVYPDKNHGIYGGNTRLHLYKKMTNFIHEMRALLVLFLVTSILGDAEKGYAPGWGWSRADALVLYGWYTGLVYITPIIGGFLADKFMGYRKAVVLGAFIMTLGHASMALEGMTSMFFYAGLSFLIVGNGFFKPNISSMVGQLYKSQGKEKDAGYTIFYMGINSGAFLGLQNC